MLLARSIIRIALFPLTAILLAQCGTTVHYVRPPDWSEQTARDSAIAAFAPALKGIRIFLDPGHGGSDRASIGPNEDVVEADVNLRVALTLRDYLKQAGASVMLSRETDQTVPLESRAEQANVNAADIFISIHHNAADNPETNYTATFYHARPGEPGYKASSHDLARYIQRDLAFVMGNPGPLASFDGTMSDDLIAPGKGFKVLRDAKMTSVLIECGFHTSAYEEQRLRLPEFNEIQAWGIFRGVSKYLRAGVPVLAYVSPLLFKDARPKLEIEVGGAAEIKDESVRVFVDGKEEGFSFNRKTGRITVTTSDELSQGYHRLSAQVRNSNENSSAPFEIHFAVGVAPVALRATAEPSVLPPDESAFSLVTVAAVDSNGSALGDNMPIRFTTSAGLDTILLTKKGVVSVSLSPGASPKTEFIASNGPVKTEGAISTSPDALYTRGIVMGSEGKPVVGAMIRLPGGTAASTNENGEYIITGSKTDGVEVAISASGYFGAREAFAGGRVQDPVLLQPIARGVLHGKTVLLDLLSPSAIENDARVDTRALSQLRDHLLASGAHPIVLPREAKTRKDRDSLISKHRGAMLIQFGVLGNGPKITVKVNAFSGSKTLADHFLRALPENTSIGFLPGAQRVSPAAEIGGVRQAIVLVPVAGPRTYDERLMALFSWNISWAVYYAVLQAEGFKPKGSKIVEATVIDRQLRVPAVFAPVELNGALRGLTDAKGVVRFRGVTIGDDDLRVLDPDAHEISGVKTEIVN